MASSSSLQDNRSARTYKIGELQQPLYLVVRAKAMLSYKIIPAGQPQRI
jgi:hypothetical protein